ncbi:MAG: chloride channel protein [Azospirillaceae bacterium]|nr:chloride channel protein [Azospirillaceae bacterium]
MTAVSKTAPRRSRWLRLWTWTLRGIRDTENAQIAIAAVLGCVVGALVTLLQLIVQLAHETLFGLGRGSHLSAGSDLVPQWRLVLLPTVGGFIVGLASLVIKRFRPREVVDPIEANALHGGRLSLNDSVNLVLMTVLSAGFGASVGMEAAYTQIGAGLSSKFGKLLRLRRGDLRMMVGCGAAAAIAAAFNAPLAGAFYAFELVIGSYAPALLAPVSVAALAATFVQHRVLGGAPIFALADPVRIAGSDYVLFAAVGIGAAGLGVITMMGVTGVEQWFRRRGIPGWLRPAAGGMLVGLLAIVHPQVLGAGHGAIQQTIEAGWSPLLLLSLLGFKMTASAISVGSGFRGGLFSASLFIGGLYGSAFAGVLTLVAPQLHVDTTAYLLVGMSAVAASIVGAPVTMIMLVVEMTADFYAALGVMIGVVLSAVLTRQLFGYSFATWRFHLRGVPVRSPHDVSWIRDLTVGRLMRRDPHLVPADLPLTELRRRFPLGSAKRLFAIGRDGHYVGMVNMVDVHNADLDATIAGMTAGDLHHGKRIFLRPDQNIRSALDKFAEAELETLPVLADAEDHEGGAIIGYLTEAYALRRYSQELERARTEDLGNSPLYGAS